MLQGVTCDGVASYPGRVDILAVLCYRKQTITYFYEGVGLDNFLEREIFSHP